MLRYFKIICLGFALHLVLPQAAAQDDVLLTPARKFRKGQVGGLATIVSDTDLPIKAGGGFWLTYTESIKGTEKFELGCQFEYNFMSSSSIYFDDASDYFSNRSSVYRLNLVSSFHPLRFKNFDIYQELYTGMAFSGASSTYYLNDDEEGSTEKLQVSPGLNVGLGIGIDYKIISLKFAYHQTTKMTHVIVDDIYYNGNSDKLYYPRKRAPLGAFSIYLGIYLN